MTPTIIIICTAVILISIAYQDIRHREVSWILFLLLAICGFCISLIELSSFTLVIKNWSLNILYLFIQYILLVIYFRLKKKGDTIKKNKIGMGDILFLISTALFFKTSSFIIYYLLSLLFSLIIYYTFLRKKSFPPESKTVPLAGFQSIFLFIFVPLNYLFENNSIIKLFLLNKLNQL